MTTRWGIAGTGGMAEAFLADFEHVPSAEVVAIGSRSRARAGQLADRWGATGMTNGELVAADLDVLYVATPHAQHRDIALAAIGNGIPVLVEKSFTVTLAGAEQVVAAARASAVFCMEAMWTRLLPAVLRARALVAAGEIGEVVAVHADLGAHRPYEPGHRLFDPALGGGAVLDLGVYVISLAQHFLGAPDRVRATGTLFPNGADATASISLAYDDGRGATLATSLTAQTACHAVLVGTNGSIEIGPPFHHPDRLVVRRAGQAAEELVVPRTGRGYAHEIRHVQECLCDGLLESPVVPLDDTLAVQRVMDEALAQLGGVAPVEGAVAGVSA
ncbi:Gfo/Idh/MocA family protein [Nocardioides xinjiangensis]|uniref:Gfo/Idh/MocA family protein n=1 Tax=Nocardioides xinjiangensis TaxID=2817376 RepID=UPI0027DB76C0|nr:Gfo/Idh/MocA family oxidoreductase [Nocardioides sp. SYSU D00514]